MAEKSILIIGAVLAGLSSGCYGQMNGYQTRIFELHTLPGGLCTSWKRKGYTFDGCIHFLCGSGPGTSLHRLYEELGAVQGRRMVDHEEYIRVEGAGGKTLIAYADIDKLERHMKELSPDDAGVIEELCNAVRLMTRFDAPTEKPRELMGLLDMLKMLKMLAQMRVMNKYSKITMQDFASRFVDPFLRDAFPRIMDDNPDFALILLIMTLADLHKKNAGWPIGGSLEFSKAIEQRYLGLGGELHYKSRVAKILVEGDRAVGVRLEDGTEHRADIIISAADGRTTIFDMLEGKYIDDKVRSYYDKWPISEPIIQISLGVARDCSNESHAVIYPIEEPVNLAGEAHHRLHVCHFCYDLTMAKPGKSVLTVAFSNCDHKYWKKLYEDRERYKIEKQRLADEVIDRLEKRFPGLKEDVEFVDVATPVTYERYTGNWQGSYMGWATTSETWGKSMSRTLPGLGSFYMAGQWIYNGGGVPGSVMSGRHLIQIICKQDKRRFTTTVP